MPEDERTRVARSARRAIATAGGLVGTADLRGRWGSPGQPLSGDRVKDLVKETGFPEAIYPPKGEDRPGVHRLWLAADVDRWWQDRQARPGRRGPKSRKILDQSPKDRA